MKRWTFVLFVPLLFALSCATPVPKAGDPSRQDPQTHVGLHVDLDLLATAKLPQDEKQVAQELLNIFHSSETRLLEYIETLEKNLDANEQLSKKYSIADAIVGALAGFSSPAVIFATAAIALPIAGALWVAAGLKIQHYNIEPQIEEADKRLGEARALSQLFPDVERAFDAFVFANSEVEADRRFRKWQVYIENLETKVSHFFAKHVNQSS